MPCTEAQKRATLKYRAKNLARITLDMPKGMKAAIQEAAEAAGLSVSRYLMRIIEDNVPGADSE